MSERTVIGCIGRPDDGQHHTCRKFWNTLFSRLGLAATFEIYPLTTVSDVQLRLAEMDLHARRGYVIHGPLQQSIAQFLDRLDAHAKACGSVDTIVNDGGVLTGFSLTSQGDPLAQEQRIALWFPSKE